MKRSTRGLLFALGALVVVAAVVWLASRPRPAPSRAERDEAEPVRFHFAEIDVRSPDLEIGPAEIRGAIYPSYSSWRVTMSCAEPDGCTGEFALEVSYRAGAETGRVVFINRCEAPMGGKLSFEGLQDRATPIDGIDRLTLEVRDRRGFDQGPVEVPL